MDDVPVLAAAAAGTGLCRQGWLPAWRRDGGVRSADLPQPSANIRDAGVHKKARMQRAFL
ncbi:MAG: hypothetical protein D8H96_07410 [Lautropia sp.]|nr:MAG: hypothetical protein D8H96_07410 [Lautropia sp.]